MSLAVLLALLKSSTKLSLALINYLLFLTQFLTQSQSIPQSSKVNQLKAATS